MQFRNVVVYIRAGMHHKHIYKHAAREVKCSQVQHINIP